MGTIRQAQTTINEATEITVATGYTPSAGSVTAGDTTQVALQKLEGRIANESIWDRSGTNIQPQTAGDDLVLTTGSTLSIADLTAGSILFSGPSGLVSQDNANLFWDDTSNALGVGTTTPESFVHIRASDAGGSPDGGTQLFVESSGSTFFSIFGGLAGTVGVKFGDSADGNPGQVLYSHATDTMTLTAATVDQVFINTTGVGVGTIPEKKLHVIGTATTVTPDADTLIFVENNVANTYLETAIADNGNFAFVVHDSLQPFYFYLGFEIGNQRMAHTIGTLQINFGETLIEFNGDGIDVDYQFRTNNDDFTLYIDGGTDSVGVSVVPTSRFHVDGSFATALTTVTGNTTLDITHHTVLANSTTDFTITLPTAVGISGRQYVIKNINTNILTIDAAGTETIDGQLTQTISTQYNSLALVSNGANWFIV